MEPASSYLIIAVFVAGIGATALGFVFRLYVMFKYFEAELKEISYQYDDIEHQLVMTQLKLNDARSRIGSLTKAHVTERDRKIMKIKGTWRNW